MSIEFVEGRYPGETGWSVDYVGLDGSSNAQNAYSGGGGYSSAGVKKHLVSANNPAND